MDIEILLDCSEVPPEQLDEVTTNFYKWYQLGAEIRHNKMSFNSLRTLEVPHRYLVDIGYADLITSFRDLHARLRRLGVKVFVHFNQ
jgi:hypothetical protein